MVRITERNNTHEGTLTIACRKMPLVAVNRKCVSHLNRETLDPRHLVLVAATYYEILPLAYLGESMSGMLFRRDAVKKRVNTLDLKDERMHNT